MDFNGHKINTLYSPAKAREIADANTKGETDGWKYRACQVYNPKGDNKAVVAVFDEDDFLVGLI